jgi:hypothetical protein
MRGAAAVFALLLCAPALAEDHQLSAYCRSGLTLYLSPARTAGGLGGGVGVRDTFRDRYLFQLDASYLSMLGNAFDLRLGAGLQRSGGTWAPSAMLVLSTLFGDRLAFLTPEHPTPIGGPALSLGLNVAPLRFTSGGTTVAVLELGVGVGSDFPGVGLSYRVGLLEVGASF